METKRTRLLIISALLAVILVGFGFGAGYLTRAYTQPEESLEVESSGDEAQAVGQTAETVASTAKVERVTRFIYCGHDVINTEDARDFAGLDDRGVQDACGEWTLTYFSRERIVLTNECSGYCPDHLVLRADASGLGVYRTDPKTTQEVEMAHFDLDLDMLPAETKRYLEEGVPFENLSEIEAYLEDLES